ncbi:pantothenate kinase mitochondrial [Stylonychia lemnae]|uniref:Pantothenate kinase mitochondrial n=1 Tax=Stylonychia lemnae TaxID=5949 RepID=A0A078ANU7_STYLE|nr:pantothenate kinase mitochondrial [Stylonychia lemnae]|eukprot:CDW82638.1 pantothenate kinase mitochondrial [Stylonychia lemnae]
MGIVVLRCSVFDRKNDLFPYKIEREKALAKKQGNSYFMTDYSFYSKEHGGTFHFIQFSIIDTIEFLESPELDHLLDFFDQNYQFQKQNAKILLNHIYQRKNIIDYKISQSFFEQAVKRNYQDMPILSTGGYNDHFLTFVSHIFNTEVVKCRDFLPFVIIALDYLNKYTNDCFFKLSGSSSGIINFAGKLNIETKPKQQYFSLKDDLYPYLLVNMRSGATFTRVDSKDSHTRLCGTSIGGSFCWGILRLLNYFDNPTEAVIAASKGDSSKVDMSVGEIYGQDYSSRGLPAKMIASSFGRLKDYNQEQIQQVSKEDISRSLLTMTAVNILIFSNMIVKLHNLKKVVWIGVHVDLLEYMQMSEQAFSMLAKEQSHLIFPRYHSFLGSLGLLLTHGNLNQD